MNRQPKWQPSKEDKSFSLIVEDLDAKAKEYIGDKAFQKKLATKPHPENVTFK